MNFCYRFFSSCVTPLNGDKDLPNFQCVYCGREWSNKLECFDHRSKGCSDALKDPITNNPIFIIMLFNLANVQFSKELKWQINKNNASSIELKMRTQANIDAETTLKRTLINVNKEHKKGLLKFLRQRM